MHTCRLQALEFTNFGILFFIIKMYFAFYNAKASRIFQNFGKDLQELNRNVNLIKSFSYG